MEYPMRYRKGTWCLWILAVLTLAMAIQGPPMAWGAAPLADPAFKTGPGRQDTQLIQHLLELVERLKAAVRKLETQRAAGVSWLLSSIAREPATRDIDMERTVLAYREWKSSDERIAERINIMRDLLKKVETELAAVKVKSPVISPPLGAK